MRIVDRFKEREKQKKFKRIEIDSTNFIKLGDFNNSLYAYIAGVPMIKLDGTVEDAIAEIKKLRDSYYNYYTQKYG